MIKNGFVAHDAARRSTRSSLGHAVCLRFARGAWRMGGGATGVEKSSMKGGSDMYFVLGALVFMLGAFVGGALVKAGGNSEGMNEK